MVINFFKKTVIPAKAGIQKTNELNFKNGLLPSQEWQKA